jgi:ribosomal-protein-alanine N-acetyltransferase
MFFPQTLRTARLILRSPHAGDGPTLFERLTRDPEVSRYLAVPPHQSVAQACQFVSECMTAWVRAQSWTWMLCFPSDRSPIGYLQFEREGGSLELGFALARPFWGRGFMPEAVRQVMASAFEDRALFRVGALCRVDHRASVRVLEKAGMVCEGLLRKLLPQEGREPADALSFARVREGEPSLARSIVEEEILLGHSAF